MTPDVAALHDELEAILVRMRVRGARPGIIRNLVEWVNMCERLDMGSQCMFKAMEYARGYDKLADPT